MSYLKICFTGYRPHKLPWKYNENHRQCKEFKKVLYSILENAIQHNYTYFTSGMALGIDTICAEIVLTLKKKYNNALLECALPCKNQSKSWNSAQQQRYAKILNKADIVHYISTDDYNYKCMEQRNYYMIKNCDVLIAVFDGQSGGTENTIKLAKKLNKK